MIKISIISRIIPSGSFHFLVEGRMVVHPTSQTRSGPIWWRCKGWPGITPFVFFYSEERRMERKEEEEKERREERKGRIERTSFQKGKEKRQVERTKKKGMDGFDDGTRVSTVLLQSHKALNQVCICAS